MMVKNGGQKTRWDAVERQRVGRWDGASPMVHDESRSSLNVDRPVSIHKSQQAGTRQGTPCIVSAPVFEYRILRRRQSTRAHGAVAIERSDADADIRGAQPLGTHSQLRRLGHHQTVTYA